MGPDGFGEMCERFGDGMVVRSVGADAAVDRSPRPVVQHNGPRNRMVAFGRESVEQKPGFAPCEEGTLQECLLQRGGGSNTGGVGDL